MIENYLIAAGLGCGTKKNFKDEIKKAMNLHLPSKWYFRTPVAVSGNGLKTATLDLAFPFLALRYDSITDEGTVLARLELTRKEYEDDLIKFLRSNRFIVPPDTANFSIIPFWAGEPGYREELEDFNGIRIHIINAVVTVKYRNLVLVNAVEQTELLLLENEQALLEIKLDKLNAYILTPEFAALDLVEQGLIVDQSEAMTDYNNALKARILILKS